MKGFQLRRCSLWCFTRNYFRSSNVIMMLAIVTKNIFITTSVRSLLLSYIAQWSDQLKVKSNAE